MKKEIPAFPVFPDTGGGHAATFHGMSLRDYFAAKAMQGLISEFSSEGWQRIVARNAYVVADEMLKVREK